MQTGRRRLQLALLSVSLLALACISPSGTAQTNFGSVNIGSSASSMVTVTIPSGGELSSISVVTKGAPNLDFTDAGGGTCAVGVSALSCTINVSFTPKFAGLRNGAVVLSDSTGVVATAYLMGVGVGPQIAFYSQSPQTIAIPATLTYSAVSVAVDGNGDVYIGDSPTDCSKGVARVLKETLSGGNYTQSVVRSGLGFPGDLAVDGAGNVLD